MRTLSEIAAELRGDAVQVRDVARRIRGRDDLEGYYNEREDLAGQLERIAYNLETEALSAEKVATWLGPREERL